MCAAFPGAADLPVELRLGSRCDLLADWAKPFGHHQFGSTTAGAENSELVHERAHQEDAASGRFQEVLFGKGIGDVGEVKTAALVEDVYNHLIGREDKREAYLLLGPLAIAVTDCIDDALSHCQANFLAVILAEPAGLSGAQTELLGAVDALELARERNLNALGLVVHPPPVIWPSSN